MSHTEHRGSGPKGPLPFPFAAYRSPTWRGLYSSLRPLDEQVASRRIFSPEAYEIVRTARIVPIVESEAAALAPHFPVCWHRTDDGATLCVLRSLLADGRGHPIPATHAAGALPLILRAYPMAIGHGQRDILIDDVPADSPTNAGAPIRSVGGRPTLGAVQRVKIAITLATVGAFTDRLSDALFRSGCLEPWPLDFPIDDDGGRARVDDLMVLKPSMLGGPPMAGVLRTFGIRAAMLISLHRISLFRIAVLLKAAKAAALRSASSAAGRPE